MRAGNEAGDCGLSAEERFEAWREQLLRTRACDATTACVEDFRAEVRRSELGPVVLLGTSFPSARFRRTERMIRRSDEEWYHVTLLTSGTQALSHGRDRTEASGAGGLMLLGSWSPCDARYLGVDGPGGGRRNVAGVGVDLPVSLMPVPRRRMRDLMGRNVPGHRGTSALLAEFLLGLDRQAAALRPVESVRLGAVVADLVSAWIARELDAEDALAPATRDRATVEGVRSFIRRNLHDPGLTPPVIAAAHHISVSHLHRLFGAHSHGETVAAFIRSQRMRKAHRDLADPALRTLPIHGIAARCGIPRASDFGRSFKAVYGLTPREHRHRALSGCGADETQSAESTTQR